MDVLNRTEIQACFNFESGSGATIAIHDLEQGEEKKLVFQKNEILFLLEGKVRLIFRDYPEKTAYEGDFIFIPVGCVVRYEVLKGASAIAFRMNGNVKLCEGSRMEEFYTHDSAPPENSKQEICTLKNNLVLWYFLNGIKATVSGGLSCRYYFELKVKELLVLLKVYYSREALSRFFLPILSPDTIFSEYVRANHHKHKTAKELAEAMNITPKQFSKRFVQVFGEPALDWMNREKARCVYSELYSGYETFGSIADKFRFSSQSHLNKFCKREFGKSPGEIRNWIKVQKKATKL